MTKTKESLTAGSSLSSHKKDPLLDFRNFLWLVWNHLNLPDPTPIQYDIAKYLQHGPRRLIIQAFRGLGKSWITSAFVVWLLYCNPQLKIMVVSASKGRSDDFSIFTQRLIYELPQTRHLIPREGQRQSMVSFDVRPARADHAPSVKSVGITGQLTGGRADIIIADDIEIPSNSATQTMRDFIAKAVTEFDDVIKTNGRVIYLGTPQTEDSLYNKLPERGYQTRIWPARFPSDALRARLGTRLAPYLINILDRSPEKAEEPTDPDRFNEQELQERALSKGKSGWALQYMLDTTLADADRYPLKLSDLVVMSVPAEKGPSDVIWAADPELVINDLPNVGLDGDRLYRPMHVEREFTEYTSSIMAIDPSGRGGDETGYVVLKMLHGRIFLTKAGGMKGGHSEDTLTKLLKVAEEQNAKKIIVEPNFGDGMFAQMLRAQSQKVYRVSIEDSKWSSVQKENRIIDTLEPILNQHRLVIDQKVIEDDYRSTERYDAEDQNKFRMLFQLTRITRDKSALAKYDRLDALAIGVAFVLDKMSRNTERARQDYKDKQLREELKDWKRSVVMSTGTGVAARGRKKKSRGGFMKKFLRR